MKLSDAWSYLKSVRCSTVEISGSAISQLDGETVVATIPKEDIRKVTLCHDSLSRHPFLRFFIGFELVLFGLIFLADAFLKAEGGVVFLPVKSYSLGIPVLPILLWGMVGEGLWLIMGVFRGKYNLLIETGRGEQKIFFRESTDVREIRDFVGSAANEYGYVIDATLFDTMHFGSAPHNRITTS